MRIILLPDNSVKHTSTTLSHRHVMLFGLVLFFILPAIVGTTFYHFRAGLDRINKPHMESEAVAELAQKLAAQKDAIKNAKTTTQNHLDALGLHMGRLQAQVMRINALGQRLARIAGLDESEFNFSSEPAMGGPEPVNALPGLASRNFVATLDELTNQIELREQQLVALQDLMMERELQQNLYPRGWPVKGGWVSSKYGYRRDPFSGKRAFHSGVDIASRSGAPIKTMAAGVVSHSAVKAGYGLLVEINHGNGYLTRYAHTLASLVKVGDRVEKGQPVAVVGNSGRSTGPHVHFEVRRDGRTVNPRKYLKASR